MPIDPRISLGVQGVQIQSPLDVLTQVAQLQQAREQTEARRLAAEEAREKKNRQARLDAAYQRVVKVGPDGRATVDFSAANLDLDPETILKLQETVDQGAIRAAQLRTATLTADQLDAEKLASLARPVAAGNYHPGLYGIAVAGAVRARTITQQQADELLDEAAADPTAIQRRVDSAIGRVTKPEPPPTAPKPGDLADFLTRYAKEKGTTVDAMGTADVTAAIAAHAAATRAPTRETTANVGSLEDYVLRTYGANPTPAQIIQARRAWEPPTPPALQLVPIIGPDGKAVLVPEGQAVGATPASGATAPRVATEGERKAAGFYGQMQQALSNINRLEANLTGADLYQIQSLPQEGFMGAMNRSAMSDAAKQYIQAFNQFTEARLRPVSGAAIADSEYARDRATYGKQYSETPDLAAQRRAARTSALSALRTMAGSAIPDDAPPSGGRGAGARPGPNPFRR